MEALVVDNGIPRIYAWGVCQEQKQAHGRKIDMMSVNQTVDWLSNNLGINADFGIKIDKPIVRKFDVINEAADYTKNGRQYSHREVMRLINQKLAA